MKNGKYLRKIIELNDEYRNFEGCKKVCVNWN